MAAMAFTILGTAASAAGSLMAAGEQSAAAEFQAEQYKIQAQRYQTAAAQDEAARRDRLTSSIGTLMAIRAGRGVGQGSPTGITILDDVTADAERDIYTSRTNLLTKADQARMASEMSERKARMAELTGTLGALETVGNAGFKLAKLKGV
jgi:hypothetical protein